MAFAGSGPPVLLASSQSAPVPDWPARRTLALAIADGQVESSRAARSVPERRTSHLAPAAAALMCQAAACLVCSAPSTIQWPSHADSRRNRTEAGTPPSRREKQGGVARIVYERRAAGYRQEQYAMPPQRPRRRRLASLLGGVLVLALVALCCAQVLPIVRARLTWLLLPTSNVAPPACAHETPHSPQAPLQE